MFIWAGRLQQCTCAAEEVSESQNVPTITWRSESLLEEAEGAVRFARTFVAATALGCDAGAILVSGFCGAIANASFA